MGVASYTAALGVRKELFLLLPILFVGASITIRASTSSAAAADDPKQKPLKILVPLRLGFAESLEWGFEAATDNHLFFSGFAVNVFRRCVEKLPYKLDYELVAFGDGVHNPTYNDMIKMLVNKQADGVVADITITEERMKLVDFTQPYIQSSLVMMVPFHYASAGELWSFLKPFSKQMWGTIVALVFTTVVVYFFVDKKNPFFHEEGMDWRINTANVLWSTFMSLFFLLRSDVEVSTKLGKVLTVCWLVVVLILTSTYTASLAAILSAQQPSPSIESYEDLWRSNLPIGYQEGSFMEDYLQKSLLIRPSRLVKLVSEKGYHTALELGPGKRGGVAAILDESPYVQSFLTSECKYTISGNDVAYFGSFGFAFQKNSSFTDDFSLAIISLSKKRELQNLKDSYLGAGKCIKTDAGSFTPIDSFGGLFIVTGVIYGFLVLQEGYYMASIVAGGPATICDAGGMIQGPPKYWTRNAGRAAKE